MGTNLKISVVIPLYNGQDVICRAIQSVIKQTVSVDEIIVVNDGSTDDSLNVINAFVNENELDSIFVINKSNGGVSTARNMGLMHASNELVAFLDCDDEWVSDKIELQLPEINKDDVVLVGGNHTCEKIKKISGRSLDSLVNEVTLLDLLFKNYFQTSTVIIKKSFALIFSAFDEKQTHAEEGQFYYNMAMFGKLIHINRQLVIYDGGHKLGFGQSGLSSNIVAMELGELRNLYYAYKKLGVGFFVFLFASLFSIVKFSRRFFIVKIKRWNGNNA